jgi:hypothetical protein
MAKVSYPTSRTIKCPLLIDASQLESLDRIIDEHLEQMREYKDRRISELVGRQIRRLMEHGKLKSDEVQKAEAQIRQEAVNDYDFRESRSVALYLTRGREIQTVRISEAISQPIGEDEIATGFSLRVRVGEISAIAKVEDSWLKQMTVEVSPKDNEVAQGLFGALSNWASDIEAPKWQQRWLTSTDVIIGILIFLIVAGVGLIPLSNWAEAGKNAQKEEARKLLSGGGVNPGNEMHAIQLLLAIASDYDPSGAHASSLGLKYWSYLSLGCLVLFSASIYPRVCIGLWRGKRRLRIWRSWIRILGVGIPTLVGSSIVLPWILYWLKLIPPAP